MQGKIIALDVGGTSIKSGIVDASATVEDEVMQTPLDTLADAETILSTFDSVINTHRDALGSAHLLGIGVGFPGPFEYVAGICRVKGFGGKYESIFDMNLRDVFRARLGLDDQPIRFRNDAEAAIVGESLYGAGRGLARVIGVTLGTGFGSRFLVDGVAQTAGPAIPRGDGLNDEPWRDSRAEDWFNITGMLRRLAMIGESFATPKDAALAARAGNQNVAAMFREYGAEIGDFLRPWVANFSADGVLVLGGIARAYDLFGDQIAAALPCPVRPGELGAQAALLGAADLILRDDGPHPS